MARLNANTQHLKPMKGTFYRAKSKATGFIHSKTEVPIKEISWTILDKALDKLHIFLAKFWRAGFIMMSPSMAYSINKNAPFKVLLAKIGLTDIVTLKQIMEVFLSTTLRAKSMGSWLWWRKILMEMKYPLKVHFVTANKIHVQSVIPHDFENLIRF